VGLREANQTFASLIKTVRGGKEVILTDRGKPVARLSPMPPEDEDAAIKRMVNSGFLRPALEPGPMPRITGVRIRGKSIGATIREERDED
jgi:prevent-host-death family protein